MWSGFFYVHLYKQKLKRMLTAYQHQLFNDLISLNWEIDKGDYNKTVKNALVEQYWKVKEELMGDMGRDEYNNYVNGMRQMFAPAKSN
jgi:hypothetical protein